MNKVTKNYIYSLFYQIVVLLTPIITTPYISRVIGAKGLGIYSYTNSNVSYFILFGCFGLNLYGQREIAYVQHDLNKRSKVFWELFIMRFIGLSLSFVIYFFSFVINNEYSYIYTIMILNFLSSIADISWFFQGVEEFKKIVIRNLIVRIVGTAIIFVFVKSSNDLWLYILCNCGTQLLGNISMWLHMKKQINFVNFMNLNLHKHIKPVFLLFLPQIATSVYTVLDKTMLGYFGGIEEEVAYYEQGQKIVTIILGLITSLGTVMLPRIADLYKANKFDSINDYLVKSFNFTFFISFPMMFGIMAISCNFVPWFFGAEFQKVIPNMVIISPIIVLISLSNVIGTEYLLPTGRQNDVTTAVIVGCFINCFLNYILIPKLLSIGAAIATVTAELSIVSIYIYLTRNEFDYRRIFSTNYKYAICSAIMFIPIYYFSCNLQQNALSLTICVFAGFLIYIFLLSLMKDALLLNLTNKIKLKIINKFNTNL